MSAVRLLFVAALRKTLHEITVGVDLARQLAAAGVRSHFVVDAFNEEQLLAARLPYTLVDQAMGPRVRERVAAVAREFGPDAVVLSDYLGHWMTFTMNYRTDPWFVEDLGAPVIPIDLYDLEHGVREVEVLGRTMAVDDIITRMSPHLRPVPMGRPDARPGELGRPYRATTELGPLSGERRREVRAGLGVGAGERLLVVPTLPWQRVMRDQAGPATRELAARFPVLLARYLRRLPDSTHLLFTGPVFEHLDELPRERTHHRPEYTAHGYDELIGSADALFAFHVPAFGLERALWCDVPGVLAVNHHEVEGPGALDGTLDLTTTTREWLAGYPGPLPAFHMWPLRWNRLLAPLLAGNPFTATALPAELLDEESVVSALERALHDGGTRAALAQARADYRDRVAALPPVAEVVLDAVPAG